MPSRRRLSSQLSAAEQTELLCALQNRFEQNMHRHPGFKWAKIADQLAANSQLIRSVAAMEATGGEPDVVALDKRSSDIVFIDCSPESPAGRRSLCYDREGLESRKEHKPADAALEVAEAMGIKLLTEDEYRALQQYGEFDTKTSSWLQTPAAIRKLGGALFGDRRYDQVFVYHNGAQSYYAARGFRGLLRV